MRWTSMGISTCGQMALQTSGPTVRFGFYMVVVHDIEVNEARTSGLHGLDLFPESGEIS